MMQTASTWSLTWESLLSAQMWESLVLIENPECHKEGFVFRVEVCLSLFCCCNKIPEPGKLVNNRNVFLAALEAGSQKSRYW
jgi:hypothetical protein